MSYSMKIAKLGLEIQDINSIKKMISNANKTNSKRNYEDKCVDKDAGFPKEAKDLIKKLLSEVKILKEENSSLKLSVNAQNKQNKELREKIKEAEYHKIITTTNQFHIKRIDDFGYHKKLSGSSTSTFGFQKFSMMASTIRLQSDETLPCLSEINSIANPPSPIQSLDFTMKLKQLQEQIRTNAKSYEMNIKQLIQKKQQFQTMYKLNRDNYLMLKRFTLNILKKNGCSDPLQQLRKNIHQI